MIERFYKKTGRNQELCFYVDVSKLLQKYELELVKWLIAETFEPENFSEKSFLKTGEEGIVEIGPRLNFETAFSTNAVSILKACGAKDVKRLERSRRFLVSRGTDKEKFILENHDRMTECVYSQPLTTFDTGIAPEPVKTIHVLEEGIEALRKINSEMGLGMDDWDLDYYHNLFKNIFKRNPTNVECFQLSQANSEHSRHHFFKGKFVLDGVEKEKSPLEIVMAPWKKNPRNSILAFRDNSSAIRGSALETIIPKHPGKISAYDKKKLNYDILFTAETHNFPSGVAPFPGAETGTGGRIRDVEAAGKGGLVIAGTAAYCVGNLNIPGYDLPWEDKNFSYPANMARPLQIAIEASNGASDYGNKFGEPVIQGFVRSCGLVLPGGERQEYIKPIMFTGGVGQIDERHIKKDKPKKDMVVIMIGGPAYRIGMGGGSASSMVVGTRAEKLDFDAVQRGDAEMEQKMNRVIRACIEMGENNPIVSIHDQGAGGPCNVLTELVEPMGGKVEIKKIRLGDKTLSVLEIWGAEYQERNALLVRSERIREFESVCEREKVFCEVLGKVTGDGKIVVFDEKDNTTPVNLELEKILGKMPRKTFKDKREKIDFQPLDFPSGENFESALRRVLRLLSVGSKRFLTNKVDRSVTGLIAAQQCTGPLQLTVSDVAVVAQSHFGNTGAAISIGEQPLKAMIDPKAGARMAVGEALMNIMWARISALEGIKCSANWMWAAKMPGEGARLYDAAEAMAEIMAELGIAVDGGKDSLSMAAKVGDEVVKSPGQLVISAYATVPDIEKIVTPDIKKPGESSLIFIDLAGGRNRLGGSALAQVYSQTGSVSPDSRNPELLKRAFNAIQDLIDKNLILSGHDRSDGGLATTLLEMAFSGNCGMRIDMSGEADAIAAFFSEELGMVIEVAKEKLEEIESLFKKENMPLAVIGETTKEKNIFVSYNNKTILSRPMEDLRSIWEQTSHQLEKLQMNPECAEEEKKNIFSRTGPRYKASFDPVPTPEKKQLQKNKPKVAIIREEGSNGDREMTSAFFQAGFEPWDVMMTDLLRGDTDLADFRGIVFVGGFSYADVMDSAKGWAGTIRFNENLKKMFDEFYHRPDTFSLGVCNGCQLMALLGWVPFKNTPDTKQPRFIRNRSLRFESRWEAVKILRSPAMMFKGMENSVLGVWVAHGEGKLHFPDKKIREKVLKANLAPVVFVDDDGNATEKYPFNPNGSPDGFTALCSLDGRHLAMMPHPERAFLKWQWAYLSEDLNKKWKASPWLRMFQNAREWCENKSK